MPRVAAKSKEVRTLLGPVHGSSAVRGALAFFVVAVVLDIASSMLTRAASFFFIPLSLVYLALTIIAFELGANWARDPVIPTRGRIPPTETRADVDWPGRIASASDAAPLEAWATSALLADRRRERTNLRTAISLISAVVIGLATLVAVLAQEWGVFVTALSVPLILLAFGELIVRGGDEWGPDVRAGMQHRAEGEIRLSWRATRAGRLWLVKVGGKTLRAFDDVGRQLVNMPWGRVDYTESERILRVSDIDGSVIYRLAANPSELWIVRHRWQIAFVAIASCGVVGFAAVMLRGHP